MTATVPAQGLSSSLFKYEYDTDYQLTKVTYPNVAPFSGEVDSWTYDFIGNRTTSTVNAATTNYSYQKIGANPLNWQRLLSDGTNSYTYMENGATQTRTGFTFSWDLELRLTSISGISSYKYDYQGRRTSRTVGASTNAYLYDGLNLIQEQGATSADYLFGPRIDEPLAMSRGGQIYYYVVDGLGSVTEVTNAAGTVQNTYLYDAWGQTRSQTGSLANPFLYTAREAGDVGTLFYRARYHQPSIGRFLSEDPADTVGSRSRYPYVYNSPVSFADALGLVGHSAQVCCKNGHLAICDEQPIPPLGGAGPILVQCRTEHEWDHHDYYRWHMPEPDEPRPCSFPNPCEGKPDNTRNLPPGSGSKRDMECRGWSVEYKCLEKAAKNGAPNPGELLKRMAQMKTEAGSKEGTMQCDITK
jgi:RHS repeat-associated protein